MHREGGGGVSQRICQRDPHHDILLHCDVYEGERSSVDKDVAYSEETGLKEVTQPDLSRRRSMFT